MAGHMKASLLAAPQSLLNTHYLLGQFCRRGEDQLILGAMREVSSQVCTLIRISRRRSKFHAASVFIVAYGGGRRGEGELG